MRTSYFIIKVRLLLFAISTLIFVKEQHAQTGVCISQQYTGTNYINFTIASSCDAVITGSVTIGPNGVWNIYGSLTLDGSGALVVEAGGVVNVYGNMSNKSVIALLPGSTLNFYGQTWLNDPSAFVMDNNGVPNNDGTHGGNTNFIAPRPGISSSFLTAQPSLSTYSSGDFAQSLDGGNVPMDIALHVLNGNNINLVNSTTRIEGSLVFDVDDGHIVAGDQNIIFTQNGVINGYTENRYVVTNDIGHVGKENYTGNFIYPVGHIEGDYTPASINNIEANSFFVSAANGTGSLLTAMGDTGVNRTWNIYATNATGNSLINLQHNTSLDQLLSFNNAYSFVTRWSALAENNTGDNILSKSPWQFNAAGTGTVSGTLTTGNIIINASERDHAYTDFATSLSEETAFYSKLSVKSILPVTFSSINAKYGTDNVPFISWKVGAENNVSHYSIERSSNGVDFITAGTTLAAKLSEYSFKDNSIVTPQPHLFYRIRSVDLDASFKLSSVVRLNSNTTGSEIVLFPQPFNSELYLKVRSDLAQDVDAVLFDMSGRQVADKKINITTGTGVYSIGNLQNLPPGIYVLKLQYRDGTTEMKRVQKN